MDISALTSISAASSDPDLPGAAALRGLESKSPVEQRKAVAGQFEAIMLRQMLTKTVGSMMGGEDNAQGSIYGYMLTDTLAQSMSAGGGMGLSKIIEQQLTPRGKPAPEADAKKGSS